MSRLGNLGQLGHRLHRGEIAYDFVGKRRLWYGVSLLITVVAIVGLAVNGLKLGIEFSGGAVFTPKTPFSVAAVQSKIAGHTLGHDATVQKLGNGTVRIQISDISTAESKQIQQEIAKDLGLPSDKLNPEVVGPSWGQEISQKAFTGLIIFMILVVIYLAIAFEWRMALAALVALIHDLTITVGVYAIVGFEVTPGTVIGLLTILGYSLYDTVVVFDGLKESTKNITKQTRFTYSELANRSLNQTLVRSINTTIVALLPVGALLFIGGGILGAGVLNDIALALFVGLTAGAYSSIFIATPLVADFNERDPAIKSLRKRVLAKRAADAAKGVDPAADQQRDAEDGETGEDREPEDGDHAAAGGVVGQRHQTAARNRGKNRPSGKRR
ncbi:protein translocase subunit SecF [Streptomyces sp. H10-C2]|uniref:protein translocase subunit SecF n=1 Tax=unclassified Streptomyces TaxID=2593676 RepID=UPI0024BAB788|nr:MULTISPECIES: protein translocase subunit SecF [unclassified Streptomyces]MDJ0345293.1 protein translocase subunit SecF [Streptomyces sp. PH10-H1]MDJ0370744.1 protein translocase subunit SecF [Streptomyces sp. H10-C2]